MRRVLPYIVMGIGILLLILGSLGSVKRNVVLKSIVESKTYEILPCNGTSLFLEANGSLCTDLRKLEIKYLEKGNYIDEKNLSFPLIKSSKGKLSLRIENYGASLNITKEFLDGGYLIPVKEGLWNVTIKSENPSTIYNIVEDLPENIKITKDEDSIKIPCGDYSILLYNPSENPVLIEVYSSKEISSLPLIALGLAAFLIGIALRRRGYAHGNWREGSGKGSFSSIK